MKTKLTLYKWKDSSYWHCGIVDGYFVEYYHINDLILSAINSITKHKLILLLKTYSAFSKILLKYEIVLSDEEVSEDNINIVSSNVVSISHIFGFIT